MRTTFRLVGVLLAGAALLTACSGGGSSTKGTIDTGADTPSPAGSGSATPDPNGNGDRVISPADIQLPPDIKLVFSYTPTGSPDKDGIIRDLQVLERSIYKVLVAGNRSAAPYTAYAVGQALGVEEDYFNGKLKAHESVTGLQRYYDFDFVAIEHGRAEVRYCFDERRFFAKNNRTGHVYTTKPSLKDFSQVTVRVAKTKGGRWREEIYHRTRAVEQCQSRA